MDHHSRPASPFGRCGCTRCASPFRQARRDSSKAAGGSLAGSDLPATVSQQTFADLIRPACGATGAAVAPVRVRPQNCSGD